MWAYGDEHPVGSDTAAVMTDMMLEFVADLVSSVRPIVAGTTLTCCPCPRSADRSRPRRHHSLPTLLDSNQIHDSRFPFFAGD